ncbi:MAG: primosomal protein N' [Firmicutes bacterium]|nr:primosomal protein N' [Bacillota bacterium]
MKKYARIVIDAVMGHETQIFDYVIPENLNKRVSIGSRVFVPFGPRIVEGFVLDIKDSTTVDEFKLKEISKSTDEFIAVKPELLEIAPLICEKFKLRLIDVLRLFVPGMVRGRKRARKTENKELKALEIKEKEITLTEHQQKVVDQILSGKDRTFLLHGVTGSGKTEVYMHVIQKMLGLGKTAIMLVPEIGLTPQVLGNFRNRFGDTVAMIHSGLSPTERYDQWLQLHNGEAKIVIGARSAVFAPLENIGIIIIDEEHDASYFSESNPRFATHDIAKMRASYNKCPLVLGSATPSIESMHNAKNDVIELLRLDRRVNNLEMPKIQIVDMVSEIRGGNGGIFSRDLIHALGDALENNRQAMIFLNRRGFASSVMCTSCGWTASCENCDVSLVWHKDDNLLKCHYCAARFTKVNTCKKCSSNMLRYGYTGTQKVVEELANIFPNIPIFRMDADNTKTKDSLVNIINDFAKTTPSILVGTQMIAKGHDFPNVDVVGIIDADNSLHFSDFRASERTFSLITQVAGRAGRHKKEGNASEPSVILQTYKPNHYVYRYAANYDYQNFFEKELNTRTTTKYPPFATIVRILVTGEIDQPIKSYLERVMTKLRTRQDEFIYLGAMKSPLGRIQNKFRYQILMRFNRDKEDELINFINETIRSEDTKKLMVFLEINPQSLS